MTAPLTRSITVQLAASTANGICQSQTPGAAGALTLNGSLVSGGVATLAGTGVVRQVLLPTTADETSKTFTITGTNDCGNTITEQLTGVNNTTAGSAKYYQTVTSITISAAAAG